MLRDLLQQGSTPHHLTLPIMLVDLVLPHLFLLPLHGLTLHDLMLTKPLHLIMLRPQLLYGVEIAKLKEMFFPLYTLWSGHLDALLATVVANTGRCLKTGSGMYFGLGWTERKVFSRDCVGSRLWLIRKESKNAAYAEG